MRQTRFFLIMTILLSLVGMMTVAQAQEGAFSGSFLTGYRFVNINDSEGKYHQHINLDDGMRLFNFQIQYEPMDESRKYVDIFALDVTNLGGDPFETIDLTLRKYKGYDFAYRRRKSDYFYEDTLMDGTPDFHTFDFTRVQDTGAFNVWVTDSAKVSLGFKRFEKEGESTTMLDIARDEFEFDKPIDEEQNEYRLALDYRFNSDFSIVLEEKIRDYENANSFFLPGFATGEDTADSAILNYYFSDEPYDFTSLTHTARVNARPIERLRLTAAASIESLDLDRELGLQGSGVNYDGSSLLVDSLGSGSSTRDIQLYDMDLSFSVTDQLSLLSGFRYHNFEQDGDLLVDGAENAEKWEYDIFGVNGGLQYQFTPALVVSGGLRHESRGVDVEQTEAGEEAEAKDHPDTTLLGGFGTVSWRATDALHLTTNYQYGSVEDPFTLSSATNSHRLRVRSRYTLQSGFTVTGSYLLRTFKNDDTDWSADQNTLNFQVGVRKERFNASVGYGLMMVKREIDQTVLASSTEMNIPVLYEGQTNIFMGQARFALNDQWALGGNIHYYDNQETNPLSNLDLRGFVELIISQTYLANLSLRHIAYEEENGYNDYSATIGEFSVGYQWGK